MDNSFTLLIVLSAATQLASSSWTQMQAQYILEDADITVDGLCDQGEIVDCVSLEGIRDLTVSGLVELQQNSGCPVEITAGTEPGDNHSNGTYTRENGYGVRVTGNDCLYKYITTHSKCRRYSKKGIQFVACEDENWTHYGLVVGAWEITFFPEEKTFFGKLAMMLRGWKISKAK